MSPCFEKDQYVVYGKMGVCRVVDRQWLSFGADKEEYYILAPVSDSCSSVYVPCGNEMLLGRLRPLLTKNEIDDVLFSVTQTDVPWVEDRVERAVQFRTIIAGGDRRQIVRLVRCLYAKKQEKAAENKKFSTADEMILQECVRLVEEEFSLALGVSAEQVGEYIRERIGE